MPAISKVAREWLGIPEGKGLTLVKPLPFVSRGRDRMFAPALDETDRREWLYLVRADEAPVAAIRLGTIEGVHSLSEIQGATRAADVLRAYRLATAWATQNPAPGRGLALIRLLEHARTVLVVWGDEPIVFPVVPQPETVPLDRPLRVVDYLSALAAWADRLAAH